MAAGCFLLNSTSHGQTYDPCEVTEYLKVTEIHLKCTSTQTVIAILKLGILFEGFFDIFIVFVAFFFF